MAPLGEFLMQVVSYFSSIPAGNKSLEKIGILKFFSEGIKKSSDELIEHHGKYLPSDVAFIQGWVHENSGDTPHLKLRKEVIKNQLNRNKFVITADSNLFLYSVGKENLPHHYLRYSMNDVFPNTGIYFDKEIDPNRWKKISVDHNISLKDYRTNGEHILICLQRNGGWSMGSLNVMAWLNGVIKMIRRNSDRKIIVRPHPGDKKVPQYLKIQMPNVFISTQKNLIDDLKNCWAVIAHNSSPTVAAAIEGYPIFVTDPKKSQSSEIANLDLNNIENPILFDRQSWIERISMFHWNFEELRNGSAWSHMRTYI